MIIKSEIKAAPYAGIGVIIFFLAMLIAAIIADGHWTLDNALSDLGSSESIPASILFNYGCCVLSGLLYFIFGWTVFFGKDKMWYRLSGAATMLAAIFLMGVGIATNAPDTEPIHIVFASSYAVAITCAMALSGIGDWNGHRVNTYITIVCLAICGVLALFASFPIFEIISVSMVGIWFAHQSVKYISEIRNQS